LIGLLIAIGAAAVQDLGPVGDRARAQLAGGRIEHGLGGHNASMLVRKASAVASIAVPARDRFQRVDPLLSTRPAEQTASRQFALYFGV